MDVSAEDNFSGRFDDFRLLAKGGLGVVYTARDKTHRRRVALKMIRPLYADDPECRERLRREWLAAGGLQHPGIVPIYSSGQDRRGHLYYTMRLIEGRSLQAEIFRLHRSGYDPKAWKSELRLLLSRFVTICHAIEYAHGQGVLHRDLKPSNFVLSIHGESIVIDWGMAKLSGAAYADLAPLTMPGIPMGTPGVIPPEQARGDLSRIGPITDIAGLGNTLYMILVGEAPFQGANNDEILGKAMRGEFRRPRDVKPEVPPDLEAVCLKAMAFVPEDRYLSALALATDIERWLSGKAVTASGSRPFRQDRWTIWWRGWPGRGDDLLTKGPA